MDENLNWKSETSRVANKVSKCIGIFLKKSTFYLSTKLLLTLYFSPVYPYVFSLQFSLGLCLQN